MSNRFFITLLVVIAVAAGAFAFTRHDNTSKNSSTTQPTNHTDGSTTSGVVLIEYGDYQCPACGQYYPIVKQVVQTYRDRIVFQFRNFPLTQIHQNAFAGARAAEAADKQGKYWEMHDLLYENQQTWGTASNPSPFFVGYAKQLGMDTVQFEKDMASAETNDKINADVQVAKNLGATATPTFVLDGKKLDENPRSIEEFNKLIDDAIAAHKKQ